MTSKRTTMPRHAPRRVSTRPSASHTSQRRWLLAAAGIAVLAVVALIAVSAITRSHGTSSSVASSGVSVPLEDRAKGQANAPVTIVEYADLQCPVCAQFTQTIEPQ